MTPTPSEGERYDSPLVTRYAGPAMVRLFSPLERARRWRDLWIALAEAQRDAGLPVTDAQVQELRAARDRIDLARVAEIERETRHDVMAHVRHYGEAAPGAKGVIHLGATSAFVTDNADLAILRDALEIVRGLVLRAIEALAAFARRERARPCLAYTHLQPAQLTTVGKRAALWIQDLLLDHEELARLPAWIPFLGVKGTTGTQASFLGLLQGDAEKVRALDRNVCDRMGFRRVLPATGQTYPRKVDHTILAALAGVSASASKMAHDVRLLQGLGELLEPSESGQIGSSAMAYKRNPMRSERICSLARFVIVTAQNAPLTAATQWLERTLDDSANRRLALAESFLATDAVLRLVGNVAAGLTVQERATERHARRELAYVATEDILMAAVKRGGDRQELHERIRVASRASAARTAEEGAEPDVLARLRADPAFAAVREEIDAMAAPARFTGRAAEQTDELLSSEVEPLLAREAARIDRSGDELRV